MCFILSRLYAYMEKKMQTATQGFLLPFMPYVLDIFSLGLNREAY